MQPEILQLRSPTWSVPLSLATWAGSRRGFGGMDRDKGVVLLLRRHLVSMKTGSSH
jgi:hypothetical protein